MPSTTSFFNVDDVHTIRELYKDGLLAPPSSPGDGITDSQDLNNRVGLIKANIANLELDAIVNVCQFSTDDNK